MIIEFLKMVVIVQIKGILSDSVIGVGGWSHSYTHSRLPYVNPHPLLGVLALALGRIEGSVHLDASRTLPPSMKF